MHILWQIFGFLFAIFFLVLIHEYGHLIVARWFKVKVLRFSIGFGKPFYIWHSKKDKTEYALAPFLLGGYVKLLDSREDPVKLQDLHLAFDHKPILQRALIICAGPCANIIFALLAFWLMFVIGIKTPKPIIGKVITHSIAAEAKVKPKEEIIRVDNKRVFSWQDVLVAMLARVGDSGKMTLQTQINPIMPVNTYSLELANWQFDSYQPDPLTDLGIEPYHPIALPIIGGIAKKSPAAAAGLRIDDKIVAINEKRISNWDDVNHFIQGHPNETLQMKILRQNHLLEIKVNAAWRYGSGWKKIGFIGIRSQKIAWPEDMLLYQKYSPYKAIAPAYREAWSLVSLNGIVLKKLVLRKISLRVLGGPISIFQASSQALEQGAVVFFGFLAMISLTLALINILPLPGLDGGYLLLFLTEAIRRKPLAPNTQQLILRLGLILLMLILVQATINDLMRIF
ncbi:MAG: RIP metalloprotease RseP [Gammaproteobacteria bacterium]|nr:RIP metalloprotease RseP [Gammaproteobacteria bacterium]